VGGDLTALLDQGEAETIALAEELGASEPLVALGQRHRLLEDLGPPSGESARVAPGTILIWHHPQGSRGSVHDCAGPSTHAA